MTVKVTKPEINVREELSAVPKNLGDLAYKNASSTMNYELIETKVLEEEGSGSDLYFNNVFTNEFASFKLVINWLGVVDGSDSRELYMRLTDSSGADITTNDYRTTFNFESSSGTNIDTAGDPSTEILLWQDIWSNIAGGLHGEINFYNISAPVVNGISTDRGPYYRPYIMSRLLGYDDGNLYGFADASARRNTNASADSYGGFKLYQSGNADFRAKTYMSLYGLRV